MIDKTEQAIFRGERAQRLLEDEVLQGAFATIEQEYMTQWTNSPARDQAARESIYLMVKTLHRLQTELQAVLQTGQVAKHNLTLAEKARALGQRFVKSS